MESASKTKVTIQTTVNAPLEKTWRLWNTAEHVKQWNNASPDWHTPKAENDLREGGSFSYRMEAKDGSFGFDFGGVYDEVKPNEKLAYTMDDGRKVQVTFTGKGDQTEITEVFDAEEENSIELQRTGWQAILDNFKNYVETTD